MISLEHPEIVTLLAQAGPGLWPFRIRDREGFILAIKSSADFILAAKYKRALKIHLYALAGTAGATLGVITAAYDREDAPATILTICSDGSMRGDILELLSRPALQIYFFDLHNSELFGGEWALRTNPDVVELVNQCKVDLSRASRGEYYIALKQRFRDPNDNGCVVEANLVSPSLPEGVSVIHVTEEAVRSKRSEGFGIYESHLEVERDPGKHDEAAIARMLARLYPADAVFVNPSTQGGKEFCDVLALGKHEAIAIHAKATLRTESRLQETNERRDSRLDKHFRKALAQVMGAERALYRLQRRVYLGAEELDLDPRTKLLIHVVVVWDKTPTMLNDWSELVFRLSNPETNVIVVVLDNAELHNMLSRYSSREAFLSALVTIWEGFTQQRKIGEYLFDDKGIASFSP